VRRPVPQQTQPGREPSRAAPQPRLLPRSRGPGSRSAGEAVVLANPPDSHPATTRRPVPANASLLVAVAWERPGGRVYRLARGRMSAGQTCSGLGDCDADDRIRALVRAAQAISVGATLRWPGPSGAGREFAPRRRDPWGTADVVAGGARRPWCFPAAGPEAAQALERRGTLRDPLLVGDQLPHRRAARSRPADLPRRLEFIAVPLALAPPRWELIARAV
jgi:hypothetical protein